MKGKNKIKLQKIKIAKLDDSMKFRIKGGDDFGKTNSAGCVSQPPCQSIIDVADE
ncbi:MULTISPECIES: hypothetical protein [Aquimarina]|uniref:hypothetical protein n=1 Tax=Aquimarina TaxID=290174 RepID=UPI001304FF45|nr:MULTISPECIES: hypothetical protein [Aquimarina]